jgi:hypothetical protein
MTDGGGSYRRWDHIALNDDENACNRPIKAPRSDETRSIGKRSTLRLTMPIRAEFDD